MHRFFSSITTSALLFLPMFPLTAQQAPLWQADATAFEVAENPYHGWKVTEGALKVSPEGVQLSPQGEPFTRFYHYLPNDFQTETPYYLQIRASFQAGEGQGEASNASEGGDRLGPWITGLTTYNLAHQSYFAERSEPGGQWALSLWSSSPALLQSLATRHELEEGVTLKLEGDPQAPLKEGDHLIVTVRTTDAETLKQEKLPAELICNTGQKAIASWNGSGGPTLTLTKTPEGDFTTRLKLDAATLALLAQTGKGGTLGIRVRTGALQQLGWLALSVPPASGGVVDWQHRVGEPTDSHLQWRELTKGEELARNRRVKLIPQPDYRLTNDENDPFDLTDGRLSTRRDDRIWFQKDAVGWYGAGGAIPSVTLVIDLEKEEPVGQIAIRLLGGREQGGLRLPNVIEFLASSDGKTYHSLQAMQKLMPAERDLSDQRRAFYVPEDGKAFVHAFVCQEAVRARYIAIRITPEASVFADELSIQRAAEGVAFNALDRYPARTLYTDGVIARPRQPEFTITQGVLTHNWIALETYSEKPFETLGLELQLPAGIRLLPDDAFPTEEKPAPDGKGSIHTFSKLEKIAERRLHVYLEGESEGEVFLTTLVDGVPSHRLAYPLRVRKLAPGPFPPHLDISLAWMGHEHQMAWPRFLEDFKKLGFNFISSFPRFWQHRNAARSWYAGRHDPGLALVEEARTQGYKIVMNESPFHEMVHTFEAARREGLVKAGEEDTFYLQDAAGEPTEYANPFYRGRYYEQEIERVATLVEVTKPDHLYHDIELWWKSAIRAKDDARVRAEWEASGKPWETFLTDAGTAMMRDLREAAARGMGEKPLPQIGLYGAYAMQPVPNDGVFDWKAIFPKEIQLSMPSLYVQGRTLDVANRVRNDYPKVGRRIIPWLTAGTYGAVAPEAIETMVLEAILNGALGVTYYEYRDFDPLHLLYHTQALSKLGRFPTLLEKGKPQPYEGSNPALHYTCFASEDEALILVGNYARATTTGVRLPGHLKGALTQRVENDGPSEWSTTDHQWEADVPPGEFLLFHQKRQP